MSYSSATPTVPTAIGAAHRWGWFVGLGVVLIALGVFAWFEVVAVTVAGAIFLGAAMFVGGVFQIIHAFVVRGWSGFLLHVLMGVIYLIGGLLIMNEPVQGAIIITLFLSICLAVSGVMRMLLALRHRELAGWWLMLFSGIISLLIGLLLYSTLPWSGLWVLGTLIAVELVVQGITWVQFGWMLRRVRSP
jgi:uncharacterized membrane protein HdeD (DUF308 family)